MVAQGISLPKTMRAVVCHGPEDYRLEELPVPVPGPGEVVIRVSACGVCASDVKCYVGAPLFWGDAHRKGYVQAPVTPGHELIGEVVALGMTEGYGCDVYIEAAGHPDAVTQGLRMIRKLGTFVEFSVMAREASVDWTIIGDSKELNIHGAHLGPYCYPVAIDYIHRGLIDVDPIVTHRMPLEKYEEAIHTVHEGKDSIKVLLTP